MQRVGARQRGAGRVEIAEQGQAPVHEHRRAVGLLLMKAGDEIEHELRDRRVLTDDDEAGRHVDAGVCPERERLLVVAVERIERRLQARRQLQRIERFAPAAPLLRHVATDVLPQIAEHRHLVAGNVLGHRHARQLDDAALDGVHEGEVAHGPREQRAFGVAGAAQEERRRGEIDDARESELAIHRLEAGDPEARGLAILLGLFLLVAFQILFVRIRRLLAVAVVRLVVDGEDVLHAH
jgi:hypothetical protein